jgi:RHS repeat-associated protein
MGGPAPKAFVNLPGGATVIYNSTGLAYYRHSDWLGSSRLTSTQGRALYSSSAYAPFGEQYKLAGTSDASFTGQNADTATSLYDFTFREHSPSQGRWISPDPAGAAAVDPTNPQSWNRYAYTANNPLALVDLLGLIAPGPCLPECPAPPTSGNQCWDEASGSNIQCPGSPPRQTEDCVGNGCAGGGGADPGPPRLRRQLGCNTLLPDGSTIGSHVKSISNDSAQLSLISDANNPTLETQGSGANPLLFAVQVYNQTNFKLIYKGSTDATFLGDAGNFAYGAVSANVGVPLWATELIAGGYALAAQHKDRNNPYGMDNSAATNVPAGYGAQCNPE